MIQISHNSCDATNRHDEKLTVNTSTDPLTKCLNRRSFFAKFESQWGDSSCGPLTVMMLDVDHLKSVNDSQGYALGDEILKTIGDLLKKQFEQNALVCRYGGEEFVAMLSGLTFDDCVSQAEQFRKCVEDVDVAGIKFTVSIGLSSRQFGSMDPQHLLDQAEESLKLAKGLGRNRVIRFDERTTSRQQTSTHDGGLADEIPFSAVTGLLSALSFRSQSTAQHCIRVADLCRRVGENLLQEHEIYRLEVAALLHDIGKIGVPDTILNKPGPLTPGEWKIMRKHDQIGVEIVRSAFASESVANVIESHHDCFESRTCLPVAQKNDPRITLSGRIIAVCDAFDSLTHDQAYRPAFAEQEAIQEMMKLSPAQFDAEVLSHLKTLVESGFKPGSPELPNGERAVERVVRKFGMTNRTPVHDRIRDLEAGIRSNRDIESFAENVDELGKSLDAREGEFAGDHLNSDGDTSRIKYGAIINVLESLNRSPSD